MTINGASNTVSAQLMLIIIIINFLDIQLPVSCYLRNKQVSLLLKTTENILVIYLPQRTCSQMQFFKLRIKYKIEEIKELPLSTGLIYPQ